MPDQPANEGDSTPSDVMSESIARIAEQSQRLVNNFVAQQGTEFGMTDSTNIGNTFLELTTRMMADPAKMMEAQMALWQGYMELWQSTSQKMMGQSVEPVVSPDHDDRRFRGDDWEENVLFDYIKQSYLLSAR
ncbi:MAG: polyhydroxyalkanoate synthase, partial [Alphaproteobacteria bacterium]